MGCSTSKAVEQPKKTIIIQQQEPVQHIIPIDDGSVINERRRVQIEEEDRSRKEALEWAEAKRREAKPPKSNKERHAKVLDSVDDKFKSLQAKLIVLYENLRKNDKEDKELPVINQNIKSDARDIESKLEDLQAMPFANDKEYLRLLKKVLQTSKTLDLEYQLLKKQSKKYPQYKKTILGLLEEQYGDLFDDSMTQGSMRKSEVSVSPNSERRAPVSRTSPSRNYLDRSGVREEAVLTKRGEPVPIGPEVVTLGFDDPFDREMAAVMQKQRDDVAFELENAVHEYERLQTNFNVMKTRQENLQKDYRAALQEIKDLQNGNRQVMNANNAIGAENENFKGAKNDVVRKHEQTKQACVELERELVELRALYTQKIAERDLMDQEHEFRVNQLEYEIKRKHEEARDIDKIRKEEDVRLREDERRLLDDERRREEHERKRRDIERKRQEDERRRVEEERIRKEEVRRVELRIEEVDRQRRNREIEQSLPPIVSDFSVGVPVPVVRDTRASVHLPPIVVSTMPTVLPPIHADSREVERKLQEDVRRIQMMNEEADRKRAHMIQQLNMPVMMEVPTHMPIISNNLPIMPPVTFTQAPAPARFGDMVLPNKYSSMTPEDVTVPMRSSLVVVEPPVVVNERPRAEITSNALEMARRARMGTDRGQLMAVMDHTRLEAQNAPISYQGGLGF